MVVKKFSIYIPEYREPIGPQRKILDPVARVISDPVDNEGDLISILNSVDACLLTMNTRITRTVLKACPGLKLIAKYGIGVDTIDVVAATEMGIPVTNTPGINCNAVAEFSIGLMINALRHIQRSKEHLKGGGWKNETFIGRQLSGCEVGIIGYGNIARLVIDKLTCLGVKRILVYSASNTPPQPEASGVEFTNLQTLLETADVVSIHKALTPDSERMIGRKELQMMQPTAYLINTSRGPLINESALIDALNNGWIAGAALDVFEQEPLRKDHPLLSMKNAVLTPHIGGAAIEARRDMVVTVAKNILSLLTKRAIDPRYVVNPEVLVEKDIGRLKGGDAL
jgi:phosphoglycerate dehydrogenase-like enzyme